MEQQQQGQTQGQSQGQGGGPGQGYGQGQGRGRGGPRGGRDNRRDNRQQEKTDDIEQRIVDVTRVAKVIKGGRRFAFRALIVVGDGRGRVGVGTGKARVVQDAIRKATDRARKTMRQVNVLDNTIPHEIVTKHGGSIVMLRPASPGTGVIAGGGVRAVLEAAGVKDVLTKSLGSDSKLNATYATFAGLQNLKNLKDEAKRRGRSVAEVSPFWRKADGRQQDQ